MLTMLDKNSNIWTAKYNIFEKTSNYNNKPWGRDEGGDRLNKACPTLYITEYEHKYERCRL